MVDITKAKIIQNWIPFKIGEFVSHSYKVPLILTLMDMVKLYRSMNSGAVPCTSST